MVEDGAFSLNIDYLKKCQEILNPKGHQNLINGSTVTAILSNWLILPIGGASSMEGLQSMGLPRHSKCLNHHN